MTTACVANEREKGCMEDTQSPLLIKRYASRRLYDTESSDYVTLQEVAALIRSGRDVRIVDLKSGDDVTRQYLIQIIAEHEANGEQLLPINVLTEVIRSYNENATEMVPQFLSTSFELLKESQSRMIKNWQSMANPLSALEEFEKGQREFFSRMLGSLPGGSKEQPEDSKSDEGREKDKIDDIKRQLAELQSKISKL